MYMRQVDPYTPAVNTCDSAIIINNYIKNSGFLPGMGINNQSRYCGIVQLGINSVISNNIIDSSGYIAIIFGGSKSIVENNFVTNSCFVLDDGGSIYTVVGAYLPTAFNDSSIIRGNIVKNNSGALAGTASQYPAVGIYCDDNSRYLTVEGNTVIDCVGENYLLNQCNNITFRNNTSISSVGSGLMISGATTSIVFGLNIKNNIFYSSNLQSLIYRDQSDLTQSIDSNYYLRPSNESGKLKMVSTSYDLPAWVTATGYDANSSSTPAGTTGAYLYYYNATSNPVTITVPATYVDPKGAYYYGYSSNNKLTLNPFTSKILLKTHWRDLFRCSNGCSK